MGSDLLSSIKPFHLPPLEEEFIPAALYNRAFRKLTQSNGVPLILGVEREHGRAIRFETRVLPESHPLAADNNRYVERLLKFLLWPKGGWKVSVGGSQSIGEYIRRTYSPEGERRFDYSFMGRDVYEKEFTVLPCRPEEVPPPALETGQPLGRHLDGCRIGFDLDASDRKVSAAIDGNPVYSGEVVWEPSKHADPDYHYREIRKALKTAAAKLPRVDAIGGSSAGIYIDNRPMIALLFRAVPPERFGEVRSLFLRIRADRKVPLEVINDGDVTALAGAMSMGDNNPRDRARIERGHRVRR